MRQSFWSKSLRKTPSDMLIDYTLLGDAMRHYIESGWRQVEVPWLVSHKACFATLSTENRDAAMQVKSRFLVGSAEQGFLDLDLPPGRYVSCSPCFRAGEMDDLHQETFMKVELHRTDNTTDDALDEMIDTVYGWHRLHSRNRVMEMVETPEGYDLEMAGVEVGSYGRRTAIGRTWLYGTGLALPRFTIARA